MKTMSAIQRRMAAAAAALAVAALILVPVALAADVKKDQEQPVKIGDPAPNFELQDQTGKTHTLADHKEKVVALIWTCPDCPFIARHYKEQSFDKLAEQYKEQGVAVLLVDSTSADVYNSAERTKAAAKEAGVKATVLLDPSGETGRAYGARHTPHVFVINKEGKLVYNGAFDDDPQGSKQAAERTNYASRAIDAALAGEMPKEPTTKPYGCTVKYPAKKQA